MLQTYKKNSTRDYLTFYTYSKQQTKGLVINNTDKNNMKIRQTYKQVSAYHVTKHKSAQPTSSKIIFNSIKFN